MPSLVNADSGDSAPIVVLPPVVVDTASVAMPKTSAIRAAVVSDLAGMLAMTFFPHQAVQHPSSVDHRRAVAGRAVTFVLQGLIRCALRQRVSWPEEQWLEEQ